jgi:hypothetical protein
VWGTSISPDATKAPSGTDVVVIVVATSARSESRNRSNCCRNSATNDVDPDPDPLSFSILEYSLDDARITATCLDERYAATWDLV